MKAIIVGGGNPPSKELLEEELNDSTYLICADGGGNCLFKYGILPNFLLGDFDSLDKDAFQYFVNQKCSVEVYPTEKDSTDSEICLYKAMELKVDEITMLGFTGSRIDHFLGNLGLLNKCVSNGIKAKIKDNNNKIWLLDRSCSIKREKDKFISFQAYSDVVERLTLKGAKYPLNDYRLYKGDPRTTSNEFIDEELEVEFTSGLLLAIITSD